MLIATLCACAVRRVNRRYQTTSPSIRCKTQPRLCGKRINHCGSPTRPLVRQVGLYGRLDTDKTWRIRLSAGAKIRPPAAFAAKSHVRLADGNMIILSRAILAHRWHTDSFGAVISQESETHESA